MVVIMFWNSKKKLKILAFSGGAEMGEVSIRIAKALEDHLKKLDSQKNLIEYFDVVAGNSIGYIITSCLIVPSDKNPKKPKFTLDKCIKNFDKDLNSINSNINMWDKLSLILNSKNTTWNKFLLFIGLKDYMFTSQDFEKILFQETDINKNAANLKLSKTIIPINIISYDIENNTPRIWGTYEAKSDPKKDFYLKDAVMASAAIPPLFASLPYISKVTNTTINDFFIISYWNYYSGC